MKFLLPLSLILFWNFSFSQNTHVINETHKDSLAIENRVEIKKPPNGGLLKFRQYIAANFKIPNVSNFLGGKIIVEFTIKIDGSVGDIKIIKDIGYGTGDQIKKILKNMPKWSPAVKDGIQVESTFTLPINIKGNRGDE
ncbi:energy transducer TonB [Flavobacterium sp.]|uniref:energy transducer TonB n=1 Tax=Flavobacterium sp. TaxID=239 RepID=UPI00375041F3